MEENSNDEGDARTSALVETPEATPPTVNRMKPTKTPLYEARNAERYARQAIMRDLEAVTGNTLLSYVSPRQQIDRDDIVAFADLLHNVTPGNPIDLLLHSPGGDIDAAEKLITLVRKRAGASRVRVIVPDFAKSAATLIALGADAIVMSDTSELGAIDPQVAIPDSNGHLQQLSAQSYLDAFSKYAQELRENPKDPVSKLMLSKMEPATVRKLERITKRSKAIAEALLQSAMIPNAEDAEKIAAKLADTKKWHSHGQMISHESAVGVGLAVEYLSPQDERWQSFWRLFCLQVWSASGAGKLFESSFASLALSD